MPCSIRRSVFLLFGIALPAATFAANVTFGPVSVRSVTPAEVADGAPAGALVHDFTLSSDADVLRVGNVFIDTGGAGLYNNPIGSNSAPPNPAFVSVFPSLGADSWITTPGGATSTAGGDLGDDNVSWFDTSNDGPVTDFVFARLTTTGTGAFDGVVALAGSEGPETFPFSLPIGATPYNDPIVGYLATRTSNSVVYEIDIVNGSISALGPSGIANIRALEYSNGVLYAAGDGGLWTVDTGTGIGSLTGGSSMLDDLAATPGGDLFGNSASGGEEQLLRVNSASGTSTPVGSMSPFVSTNGLAIDADGTAVGWDDGAEWLFEVDLTDGSATSLGQLNDAFFHALDFGPSGQLYGWTGSEVRSIDQTTLTSESVQGFNVGAFSFTLVTDSTPFWNKKGPGQFDYDHASNWSPFGPPSLPVDANFVLDGDVEITLGPSSEAKDVKFINGTVRLGGSGSLTNQGTVKIGDAFAAGFSDAANVTLDGTDGATWSSAQEATVGHAGYGTLSVTSGGQFDALKLFVGNAGTGTLNVSGTNSTISTTHPSGETAVIVGSTAGVGVVNVSAGGELTTPAAGTTILGGGSGATGSLNVDHGQVFLDDLIIGFGGSGSMQITGGLVQQAVSADSDVLMAVEDPANDVGAGDVLVTGDGTQWSFRQGSIGVAGVANVAIEAGGKVSSASDITLGVEVASEGNVTVQGTGSPASSLEVGGVLNVGAQGLGTLNVQQGGTATAATNVNISSVAGNPNLNTVFVDGNGSSLEAGAFLHVGQFGRGALSVADGATVTASNFVVAQEPGSEGVVSIVGQDSSISAGAATIATQSSGVLSISEGALFETERFWSGFSDGSSGEVYVDGVGSQLLVGQVLPNPIGLLRIGGTKNVFTGGTGFITVSGGGELIAIDDVTIGPNATADGTLTVTGDGSLADFTEQNLADEILWIGDRGVGRMSVLAGGRVLSEAARIGEEAGSDGTATVDGEGSSWETDRLVVGNAGVGKLVVTGGIVATAQNGVLGQVTGSVGTAAVGNGATPAIWHLGDSLFLGGNAASAGGSGALDILAGGSVTVAEDLKIWVTGAVNLSGGTLMLKSLNRTAGSQFNFVSGELIFGNNAANNRVIDAAVLQDIFNGDPTVGASQRLAFDGPVTLNTPLRLDGGELALGSVSAGAEAAFRSNFAWEAGLLEITGSDLMVNAGGPLGPAVDLAPAQRLIVSGGLSNSGQVNILGTSASFGAASTVNAAGELNGINATLSFTGGLTYSGEVDLRNSTVAGDVANAGGNLALTRSNVFENDLTLGTGDNVFIDLAGLDDFDALMVSGNLNLGGTLQLSTIGGFVPTAGDRFAIVEAGATSGTFDDLPEAAYLGSFSGTDLHLVYTGGDGNDVEVIAKIFSADYDFDGDVDPADLDRWQGAFGVNVLADANIDGRSGGADFLSWQRQNGSGVAANVTIPEPISAWLLVLSAPWICFKRRPGMSANPLYSRSACCILDPHKDTGYAQTLEERTASGEAVKAYTIGLDVVSGSLPWIAKTTTRTSRKAARSPTFPIWTNRFARSRYNATTLNTDCRQAALGPFGVVDRDDALCTDISMHLHMVFRCYNGAITSGISHGFSVDHLGRRKRPAWQRATCGRARPDHR